MEKIRISSEKNHTIKDYILESEEIIIDLEEGGKLSQRLMDFLNKFTCVKEHRYKYYVGEIIYISYEKNNICVMTYNCGDEKNSYYVPRNILLAYLTTPYEIIIRNSKDADMKIVFHAGPVWIYDLYQKDIDGMWKLLKKGVSAAEIVESLTLDGKELFQNYLPF